MATFLCDNCGHTQDTPDEHIGRRAKCPTCGTRGTIVPTESDEYSQQTESDPTEFNDYATDQPSFGIDEDAVEIADDSTPTDVVTTDEHSRRPETGGSKQPSLAGISRVQATTIICLLALIAIIQLLALTAVPTPTPEVVPVAPVQTEWEYRLESPSDILFDTTMDRLGEDGWELVFARRATGSFDRVSYEMILRRPKKRSED